MVLLRRGVARMMMTIEAANGPSLRQGKGRNTGHSQRWQGGNQQSPSRKAKRDDDADGRWNGQGWRQAMLRHEDAINCLRKEFSWVIFLKTSVPSSVVPALAQARVGWNDTKLKNPSSLTKPMRGTLFVCLFSEMLARMVAHRTDTKLQEDMEKLRWYSVADQTWTYMAWNAETKQLCPDSSRKPLSADDAVARVQSILRYASEPETISRFHPTRPLVPDMKGDAVTMILQAGLRTPSALAIHEDFRILSGSAVGLLVGLQLKPDRGQRSALAQALSKDIVQ